MTCVEEYIIEVNYIKYLLDCVYVAYVLSVYIKPYYTYKHKYKEPYFVF